MRWKLKVETSKKFLTVASRMGFSSPSKLWQGGYGAIRGYIAAEVSEAPTDPLGSLRYKLCLTQFIFSTDLV